MPSTTSPSRAARRPVLAAALLLAGACSHADQPRPAAGADSSATAAVAAIASAVTSAAPAATGADAEAERYTLTMPVVEKSMRALTNLQTAQKRHPDASSAIMAAYDMGRDTSWEPMLARLDAQPIARQAVESAGLSTRDYILTNWVLLKAAGAQGMVDAAGMDVPSVARTSHVSPENITFMQQHGADVRRLQAEAVAKARGG